MAGGGKAAVPVAPTAPDNSAADKAAAEKLAADMRKRQGRAGNIATSGVGLLGLAKNETGTNTLGG
jgi:hypothetical protein